MAEGQTHESLTPEEIQAFATKLEAWGDSLTPKEQAFLLEILGRAASTEDVTGHSNVYFKLTDVAVLITTLTRIGSVGSGGSVEPMWDVRDTSRG